MFRQGIEGDELEEGKTHPPALLGELEHFVVRPEDVDYEWASEFVDVPREEYDRPFVFEDELAHFRWALAGAETNKRIGPLDVDHQ